MTLYDIASITSASTLFKIIPNNNPHDVIDVYAVSIRRPNVNAYRQSAVTRYVNDHVLFIDPSDVEPNVLLVYVDHTEK